MDLNPQDILKRIRSYTIEIGRANAEFVKASKVAAEAERVYRMAKAKKELQLKAEGYPVTLILDLAKGDKEVSLLAMQRDVARSDVEAQRFKIYSARDCLTGEQATLKWLGIEYNASGQE